LLDEGVERLVEHGELADPPTKYAEK